jgi:enoyl-CoA hydratase/carnithine racemase
MSTVILERPEKHIALVTLNRPEAYNAINQAVTQELHNIVEETEADPEIRVVILTGAGPKAFCAGADLKEISSGNGDQLFTESNGFAGFVYAKRRKPWIAAVNGFALAGGFELCLACEMIVAVEQAKFGLPEVKRGLVAGAGGMFRLPLMIPQKIANELIATGNHFDTARALQLGIVNRAATSENLIETAFALAREIAVNAPLSVAESLELAKSVSSKTEEELWAASTSLFEKILKTEDAMEGSKAFVEKREPVWKGK